MRLPRLPGHEVGFPRGFPDSRTPVQGAVQTFTTTRNIFGAQRSSAEWIEEAPSGYDVLPLANFGIRRQKEIELHERLRRITNAIDQYHDLRLNAQGTATAMKKPPDIGQGF